MPDYPLYMDSAKVTRRETAAALREHFPRFGKSAMSMVCNPDDYGVQLTQDAERRLAAVFGWHPGLSFRPRKPDRRTKANRLTVRLDDAMYKALEDYYKHSAFASKQDLIEAAIALFLNSTKWKVEPHEE